MPSIGIVPFQLSLESMVLLREVFFSIMIRVSPGSDGSYGGDNHFQYINVPAHKTFEWGYRRG